LVALSIGQDLGIDHVPAEQTLPAGKTDRRAFPILKRDRDHQALATQADQLLTSQE